MPESSSGNRYCITLTDYFSKWAEAAPILMPTKEAVHVANFLYKMFLRHGCPQEIISDQGREFCNQLVDLLEELTGFKRFGLISPTLISPTLISPTKNQFVSFRLLNEFMNSKCVQ